MFFGADARFCWHGRYFDYAWDWWKLNPHGDQDKHRVSGNKPLVPQERSPQSRFPFQFPVVEDPSPFHQPNRPGPSSGLFEEDLDQIHAWNRANEMKMGMEE